MSHKFDDKNLNKALEKIGKESVSYLTKILLENDKKATGHLIESLDYKVVKDIEGLMLIMLAEPYFKYIDKGRKPGKQPPVKVIEEWIKHKKAKLITNRTDEQSAFLTARSIGKKEIKPLNAKIKLEYWILTHKDKIVKAAGQDIQYYIDKIFFNS